jgi:hypothetical protein
MVHSYNTRSKTRNASCTNELSTMVPIQPSRQVSASHLASTRDVQVTTQESVCKSRMFPKLGAFLAAGGIITTLYSFGKDAAYQTAVHGAQWLGWSTVNQVTGLSQDSENAGFFTRYISTYTQLRQEAQAGYFEGYLNITLSIAALLGVAFTAHMIYKKYAQ